LEVAAFDESGEQSDETSWSSSLIGCGWMESIRCHSDVIIIVWTYDWTVNAGDCYDDFWFPGFPKR
jgi:hypothetical protein